MSGSNVINWYLTLEGITRIEKLDGRIFMTRPRDQFTKRRCSLVDLKENKI